MTKEIEERKAQLDRAKSNLKAHFVGIDQVIDNIFKNIELWWCYPEFLTRPTIVSLWGMTGCGKTDLVRRLAAELNIVDRFCNVELDNTQRDPYAPGTKSILGKLYVHKIKPSTQAIVLLDEIQRNRTLRRDGLDIKIDMYDDMWKLLSDGQIVDEQNRISSVRDLVNYITESLARQPQRVNAFPTDLDSLPPEVREKIREASMYEEEQIPLVQFDVDRLVNTIDISEEDINDIWNYKMLETYQKSTDKGVAKAQMKWVTDYQTFYKDDNQDRLSKLLRGMTPSHVVVFLTQKCEELTNKRNEADPERFIYSKLLIFISGNLDGIFKQANDVEYDADKLREATSKITTKDVKAELLKLFRPEQVSRFGNNHIIYPSLSRKHLEEIIVREIRRYSAKVEAKYGIDMKIDEKNFIEEVFEIGVYPAQGVRPLFSTINSRLGEIVPMLLVEAKEKGLKQIVYPHAS
jgi:cell division protease FtsH